MKSFGWCVWLIPERDHPWNDLTNGFPVHMTIKSYLNELEAIELVRTTPFFPLTLTLVDNPVLETTDDFRAIYYRVEPNLDWFPENAHISFWYQYDKWDHPIPNISGSAFFTQIVAVDCNDHFTKWQLP